MSLSNKELLDKIKDEVAREISGHSANTARQFIELEFTYDEQLQFVELVAERFARLLPKEKRDPDLFYGYLEEGVYGEFRHVPEPSPNKNKIGFIFGGKRYEFTRCPAPVESQEEPKPKIYKKVKTIDIPEIDQIMSSTPDEVRKYIKEKLNKVARVMTEDCTYEEAERNWQNDNSPLSFIEYLKKYYTITRKPE